MVLHGEDALKIALGKNVRSVQLASKSTNLRPGTQKTFGRKNTVITWLLNQVHVHFLVKIMKLMIKGLSSSTRQLNFFDLLYSLPKNATLVFFLEKDTFPVDRVAIEVLSDPFSNRRDESRVVPFVGRQSS